MPVITPTYIQKNLFFNADSETRPRGQIPQWMYQTFGRGVPRYEDLISIRVLEETHTITLPMDTIINQITTTPFIIRPTVDDPTPYHEDACLQIYSWLDGNFNQNKESLDHFWKMVVKDVLSIDAGIIEKVPEEINGKLYLGEMYARNGATFVKNPDIHGRLPPSGTTDPAYYQYGLYSIYAFYDSERDLSLVSGLGKDGMYQHAWEGMRYGRYGPTEPVPFTSDQVAWLEENPRTWNIYGQGRVQKVRRLAEIILNQDVMNSQYFKSSEIPEGVLNLVDANQTSIDRVRQYWNDSIRGKRHKLPILGGKVDYQPFRPSPRELDFVASQEWFNQLVWMCFGLNQNEVGDLADVNRATAREQSATLYRRTTMPLLNFLEQMVNTEILPYLYPYHQIRGEVEFAFIPFSPEQEAIERETQIMDLTHNLRTVNEIRLKRGEDTYRWGDIPTNLLDTLFRTHPEWAYENFIHEEGMPEPPKPSFDMPFMFNQDTGRDSFFCHKTPLRNEPHTGEFPPMTNHITEMADELRKEIRRGLQTVYDHIEDMFPEERIDTHSYKTKGVSLTTILGNIKLALPLTRIVARYGLQAMERGVEHEMERLLGEIEEISDEHVGVDLRFNIHDTLAYKQMEERAGMHMLGVEQEIKNQVAHTLTEVSETGGNIQDATKLLNQRIPEISKNHANLVARTETLSASRHGVQALGESTDLISHKRWRSSNDGRERSWHRIMDGVVVPKDEPFIVPKLSHAQLQKGEKQPANYPREAFVVGDDQPYNCRCLQQNVLRKDIDKNTIYTDKGGIYITRLTKEEGLLKEHGQRGETFNDMIFRMDEEMSRTQMAETLGVSKPTLYKYLSRAQRDG